MKTNWEHVVDYARGLASPEVAAQVEADPDSVALAQSLRAVNGLSQDEVPELWALRAKGLVSEEVGTIPLLWGKLSPGSLRPAFGLRSTAAQQVLKFDFDHATVEVMTRFDQPSAMFKVRGVIEGQDLGPMRVGDETDWLGTCDEYGQFAFEVSREPTCVRLQNVITREIYQVSLSDEN